MFKLIKHFFGLSAAPKKLVNDHQKQGNEWLSAGNLKEAEQSYREAIKCNPKEVEGYVSLGFVLIEQQEYKQAIKFLKQALIISPTNIDVMFMLGLIAQHEHKADEATAYFYKVVDIDPSFDMVYPHLYSLLISADKINQAEQLLNRAIIKNPHSDNLHYLLGECSLLQNKTDKAIDWFSQALSINPDQAQIHCKLGDVYQRQNKLEESIKHYTQALQFQPGYVDTYNNLGAVFVKLHRMVDAIDCFKSAIRISPENAQLYFNLGSAYKEDKNPIAAIENFEKAIKCDATYSLAYHQLGMLLQEQGDFVNALKNYQMAISIEPNFAEVEYCMGMLFNSEGDFSKALDHYQRAIIIKPDYSDAYNNIANIFRSEGKINLAIEKYEEAISFNESSFNAYNDFGVTLQQINQFNRAIECYRKAIFLHPGFGEAYNNLGSVLSAQGYHDQALNYYQTALSLMQDNVYVLSGLLFLQSFNFHENQKSYFNNLNSYGSGVLRNANICNDWLISFSDRENKPLRIGMVSGDFCKHPVGYFLENVLKYIDVRRLELLVYSTQPKEDELTQRLKEHCASWTDISYLSDEVAAKRIRDDGVDILIDLAGHTGHNRLPLFAWKPAPVQVTWLGYWASTGVPTIDYVLADELSLPSSFHNQFTEKVWYLPNTRMCFSAPTESVLVSGLPAQRHGSITFGSFQNMSKISDEVLALWSKVLNALPESRLRLQNRQLNDESMQISLQQRLLMAGVALERVRITGGVSRQAYLEAHSEVDIILDTFPFSGGTTTCEALWMGVPTVTLAGSTMIARQGASMMTCAGLPDWVAHTEEEYVNIAISKANDVVALSQLRADLREQVLKSPLFDAPAFARNFENALHDIWKEKVRTASAQG